MQRGTIIKNNSIQDMVEGELLPMFHVAVKHRSSYPATSNPDYIEDKSKVGGFPLRKSMLQTHATKENAGNVIPNNQLLNLQTVVTENYVPWRLDIYLN